MKIVFLFCLLSSLSQAARGAATETFFQDLAAFRSQSLTLRTELARLESGETVALSRALAWTPALSLQAGRQESQFNGERRPKSDYLAANLSWNLFRGGSDLFAWKAARASAEAQRYQVENEKLEVELGGARVIFRRLYLSDVLATQGELLKLKEESLRIARSRYNQGKAPLQEVTKLEVDLAQSQNALRLAELNVAQNLLELRALFVDSLQTAAWPFAENQEVDLRSGSGSLFSKKRALEARAQKDGWRASRLLHLPSVDWNLQLQQSPLRSRSDDLWSSSLLLTVPLWSRFETAATSATAYASYVAAENESLRASREEGLKREYLEKKLLLSRANLLESKRTLEKSERLYQDMLRSFQVGRLSANDLFLEQNRRIETLLSYSQSRLSFHEGLMEACALWGLEARDCLR